MTLDAWLNEHSCHLVETVQPPKDSGARLLYVVAPDGPLVSFRGPARDVINARADGSGGENVVVKNHPATWDYALMPRWWRERLFPSNFERWTEAEHKQRPRSYSWPDQQRLWWELDAWEDYFDGKLTLAQARQLVADLGPRPRPVSLRHLVVRSHQATKAVTVNPNKEAELMSRINPVPLPEAAAEGQAA